MRIAGDIEAALEQLHSGRWQRLTQEELKTKVSQRFVMGWRVNMPLGSLQFLEVDSLILAVDNCFPYSQIRIFAPAAGSDYCWPHIEQNGLLCLRPTRCSAPTADRIAVHMSDAEELLNYSETTRRAEFEREFATYWAHMATDEPNRARVLSLVAPRGEAREVFYFNDTKAGRFIIGDEKPALVKWLRNSGVNPGNKDIFSTWLFRLSRPWTPKEFPLRGAEIAKILPPEVAPRCLIPGLRVPFLFEADTETGTAFVAVVLRGPERRAVVKGFRHISRVPIERIVNFYTNQAVDRCKVSRVDGAWVHGRDHSLTFSAANGRSVAIIGCGAIGASLARILAQAGVGEIMLVDGDSLTTANVSRHLLGIGHVGFNKASLLQCELSKQFPHLTFDHAFQRRFEHLTKEERGILACADLIIACGIDFDGEATLDTWRRSLPQPPAYLSTWVEAYAVAGHAVLLYGDRSILSGFDEEERPKFRLTDWPEDVGVLIAEAGCGNSFQPHGVVDLHPTIGLAAGLAIDATLDKVPVSCRRVWMGDPSAVELNGGKHRSNFTEAMTIREFPWQ